MNCDKIIFIILSFVSINIINLFFITESNDYPLCSYVVSPKNWMISNSIISIAFITNLAFLFIFELCSCLKNFINLIRFLNFLLYIIGFFICGWIGFGFYILIDKCSIDNYPRNVIITFGTNITLQILYFIIYLIKCIRGCKKKVYSIENV
jgi:hypothetical protein